MTLPAPVRPADTRPGRALAGSGQVTYVVLAKAPVPGLVKTRLTTAYSEHEAAALAAAALLDTLDAVTLAVGPADADARRPVCALTGEVDHAAAPAAVRSALAGFAVVSQRGDGLGPRLAHAHLDAAGEDGATVQIGMDTPQVQPAELREAADRLGALDGPDAVLGPAQDGGWWLLGLRHARDARLVADVPMSTAETGRLTLEALERAGLRVELLPTLVDVDEPADVLRVAAQAPGTRFAALARTFGFRVVTR